MASWKCPGIFLPGVSIGALELSFPGTPELSLGIRYTSSSDGLVSSAVGLGGLANEWPRRLPSSLFPLMS
jgi:hypothetical protein